VTRGAAALGLAVGLAVSACGDGGPPLVVAVPATTAASQVPAPTTPQIVVKPYEPTVPVATTALPTTTLPGPLAQLLPLGEGGLGGARFGEGPEDAIQEVRRWLKEPDEDTGWLGAETPYGVCPGATFVRLVRWGWLMLVLADRSDYGVGREHFAGWVYAVDLDEYAIYPEGLAFSTGVGLGINVEQLRAAYPGGVTVGSGTFSVGRSFSGRLGPDGTVSRLEAGLRCAAG
jgi:hypothetical protein